MTHITCWPLHPLNLPLSIAIHCHPWLVFASIHFYFVDIRLLASRSRWCTLNNELLQLLGEPPDFHNSAPHLSVSQHHSGMPFCSMRCYWPRRPIDNSLFAQSPGNLAPVLPCIDLDLRCCCSNLASSVVSLVRQLWHTASVCLVLHVPTAQCATLERLCLLHLAIVLTCRRPV